MKKFNKKFGLGVSGTLTVKRVGRRGDYAALISMHLEGEKFSYLASFKIFIDTNNKTGWGFPTTYRATLHQNGILKGTTKYSTKECDLVLAK